MRSIAYSLFLTVCTLSLPLAAATAAEIEEGWERDLQHATKLLITEQIQGLDTPIVQRRQPVKALVHEGSGANAALTLRLLAEALSRENRQTREGSVDVLAQIGNAKSVPALAWQLRYDTFRGVRMRILRVLPVFLLQGRGRLRHEVLELLDRDTYAMPNRLRKVLRQPPRRSSTQELDSALDRLQQTIARAIIGQLDPVASAIVGLGSTQSDTKARKVLQRFCGRSLGRNREEWLEAWKNQGLRFDSPLREEITTLQVAACEMIADIGAEGSEQLCARLLRLVRMDRERVTAAALATIGTLTDLAQGQEQEHRDALKELQADMKKEAEASWRTRKLAAARRMIVLAQDAGARGLASKNPSIRAGAYGCLGASRKLALVKLIRHRALEAGESVQMRVHVARALGRIGGGEAVQSLAVFAGYRSYAAQPRAQNDEYQLVWAAINGLGEIAGRFKPQAGEYAAIELLRLLEDQRQLPGGPRRQDGKPHQVRDLALRKLQEITGLRELSYAPKRWRDLYHQWAQEQRFIGD